MKGYDMENQVPTEMMCLPDVDPYKELTDADVIKIARKNLDKITETDIDWRRQVVDNFLCILERRLSKRGESK